LTAGVRVSVGGEESRVLYAGAAPGLPNGVLQLNVEVPASARSGSRVPLVLQIDGQASPEGVTLEIQ
jgi:uncharacterized protein (TIGR03437 family)